ncbi:MAG TPA: DNA cytosine methyltransferase [Gaiellales bacterium]|nr:DNA cytosine methyltransferase [Gaiellales bacterium]
MTCGDLFAGIGGMSLGLERAGFTVRWQVEVEPYCENVLARHWPLVHRRRDVRFAGAATLERVDCIAGGFPCQDISSARTRTRRVGLAGRSSGLWSECRRLVGELEPRWLLLENSPEWRRWVPEVRADLARLGYASLPVVVSAGAVGAPHSRPRGFVVAHADADCESLLAVNAETSRLLAVSGQVWPPPPIGNLPLAHGISGRLARARMWQELRALGNAVLPQVVEVIGRAILAVEAAHE